MSKPTTDKRADIQGLRGLAVLAVLVFHAAPVALPGGFAGVDVFFVISGYLITRILLDALDGDHFSLSGFYGRRIRRLFPALYAMLAVVLVLGLIVLPPKLLTELVFTQFFTSLFLSNFAFAHLSGYFDSAASLKPLLHTWTLGVEEQFYLVYPLVFLGIWKFLRRQMWIVLAGLALLSFAAACLPPAANPEANFYLPVSRAFELLIGALSVGIGRRFTLSGAAARYLSLGGLALVLLSFALLRDSLPFPGVWALPVCLGTAMLLVAKGGWAGRLLAAPPLTYTGDMSYSLYLWHWPILVFSRMLCGDHAWVTAISVVAAFGLAWASRCFIELPFLQDRVGRIWTFSAAAMAASIVLSLLVYGANGLPGRFDARERQAFAAADDYSHDRGRCHLGKNEVMAYNKACIYGDAGALPSIAVWGDSHGTELAHVLGDRLAPQHIALRQITASACPPSVGFETAYNLACREHNADTLMHLKADGRIRTVILTTDYLRYDDQDAAAMMGGLELSAMELRAAGKQVVIVYPTPLYGFDPPSEVGLALRLGRDPRGVGQSRAQFERDNGAVIGHLDDIVRTHGLVALRPSDVLCDASTCHVYDPAEGVLYFNGQHLSLAGARLLAAKVTR